MTTRPSRDVTDGNGCRACGSLTLPETLHCSETCSYLRRYEEERPPSSTTYELSIQPRNLQSLGRYEFKQSPRPSRIPPDVCLIEGYPLNTIPFYNPEWAYFELTNRHRAPIVVDGKHWPSTEHFHQAQKYLPAHPYLAEKIRRQQTPRQAVEQANDKYLSMYIREDWDKVKDDIMRKALRAKFTQHPELARTLMETQGYNLVQHTADDAYWGDGGGPGKGRNRLGEMLMELRDELLRQRANTVARSPEMPVEPN